MGGGVMLPPPVAGGVGAATAASDHLNLPRATNLHSPNQPTSSSCPSHLNLPVAANSTASFRPIGTNSSCPGENKSVVWSYYDSVFGPVPSPTEANKAISDLQSFLLSFQKPGFDWLHQMISLYSPRMLQSLGYRRVDDAFRLLQTEPSIQKMVVSISSDKAVWDAIMNNKAVQDLRQSLCRAKEEGPESSGEDFDLAAQIVKWILDMAKAMVMELIEKFSSLVDKLFQPPDSKNPAAEIGNKLDNELRSSLLLSIVIILIVVVTRAQGLHG
ncbi:uncharacterized protein LOC127787056 [Diospyros lotus]|uniref:uncharacterized protein LOC127787056 n=1 Tax=Diospyros lotus TaxID=55363 RepID=UPI002250A1E0|nr:uncharacterized protein LOC127787056 [Diospyros lotus]